MSSLTGSLVKGSIAGATGVFGMVGAITTLRRSMLTSEQLAASKTHPEKIIEALAEKFEVEIPSDTVRRQAGDAIHFGYGAVWGALAGVAWRNTPVAPVMGGLKLAAPLWAGGFGALLPALKAHPPFWEWEGSREFVLTSIAHVAYGVTTAATYRLLSKHS